MIDLDYLKKTVRRADNSLTPEERAEFRKTKAWCNFRNQVAERQNMLDYITHEPLKDNYNCHHLCMKANEYTNLQFDRFIAVNKDTHEKIHELFTSKWQQNVPTNSPFYDIMLRMSELNDDIEQIIFENHIDYKFITGNKLSNALLAKKWNYPTNNYGMMQWHKRYIPSNYPQDTIDWIKYMTKLNNTDKSTDIQLLLELRHINLKSSYQNFRNNTKYNPMTKKECRRELEITTQLLRKCYDYT